MSFDPPTGGRRTSLPADREGKQTDYVTRLVWGSVT